MISIRRAVTPAFAAVLCCCAAADEIDVIELESPAHHVAYLSTSDVVITGRSKSFGRAGTILVLPANGTAQHAKASFQVGPREENGSWVCWIASPQHGGWMPGAYRVQINIGGQRTEVPITFAADPVGDGVPIPVPTTTVDSGEYQKLPAIKLGVATVPDANNDLAELLNDVKRDAKGITVDGEDEFAVEGTIRLLKLGDSRPFGVILRLTDVGPVDGIEKKHAVTVGESFARPELTDERRVFRYQTVVRAPNQPGKLLLEAIYNRRVIAASPVEIRRVTVNAADPGWVVEYPSANAVYAPSSEIVVAGRGGPAQIPVVVQLHDKDDVIHQSGGVRNGTPAEAGVWSCRLPLPGAVWHPGEYRIAVCPLSGRQISFPITIITDAAMPAGPLGIQTMIGSDDYAALPCLSLPDVILSTPDSAVPKVNVPKKADASIFEIYAGQEFSCECTLTFEEAGALVPFDVILRLSETTARDGQKPGDSRVIVGEAIGKYQLDVQERQYTFRSVLRAPSRPGNLKLDVIYRKTVIASAKIDVLPAAKK